MKRGLPVISRVLRARCTASKNIKKKVLITGVNGQIGTELIDALRKAHGADNVIGSDIRLPPPSLAPPFEFLDCTNKFMLESLVAKHGVNCIIHNAAFLSAAAERNLDESLKLFTVGTQNVLEMAHKYKCQVMIPSSIAAFGPSTPLHRTPQVTVMRPTSVYGIGKVYAELLGEYYHLKFGTDFRSLRYPGIISWKVAPAGGTTDYACDIFYYAIRKEPFACFLTEDVKLPFMYMPDCINSTMSLLAADPAKLKHRTYNVTSFNVCPGDLVKAIRKYVPDFEVSYKPDKLRQGFAMGWPKSIDDDCARADWGWKEEFDLDAMVRDMLKNLSRHVLKVDNEFARWED